MSRLDYAPKLGEIEITDIKKGLGVFKPKPEKRASFAALKSALKKAGYALDAAEINVAGTLQQDDNKGWIIVADLSGQQFALLAASVGQILNEATPGMRVEITGDWKTVGLGAAARETITPRALKKLESKEARAPEKATAGAPGFVRARDVLFVPARNFASVGDAFAPSTRPPLGDSSASSPEDFPVMSPSRAPAPIRVTSPGLTVYKGGAFAPRLYFIEQHLGNLSVSRRTLDVSLSYTPTPRVQVEVEVPFTRTSFADGAASASGATVGLGNVTVWGKYRFFRRVKTYGDRQAAARVGLELPTGKKSAPDASAVNAPAFVRQQLTPINGGFSPHFDVTFSQAGGRFIFGGNVEAVLRSARDGYRLGHEVRVNTDLEYVMLPFKYDTPGHELFVILESTFIARGLGRVDSTTVPGSNATEYYLAPGLQYAAAPRFLVEASLQLPVVRNTGALVLRNDRNVLLGVRYLF